MNIQKLRPIPKYIQAKIQKLDNHFYPAQDGKHRFFCYLTTLQKELVKMTVAVRNHKKKWYCKQVAVHGVKSDECWVRDLEYNYMGAGGFRVGWHTEGLYKCRRWFEDGKWYCAKFKYYNPYSILINKEYVGRFSEFKYSAYQQFSEGCLIKYLRQYLKFPQTEYLIKLGLSKLHTSKMILDKIAKDKQFCKWLIANKVELASSYFYMPAILQAYKRGKSIKQTHAVMYCKKRLKNGDEFTQIKNLFPQDELPKLFDYLEVQNSDPFCYRDYLTACLYLGLDMNLPKNRYPHDFNYWHDVRIDEYRTAKAVADEHERKALYEKFAEVASKYMALQNCKGEGFVVFIAASPQDLVHEGEKLEHCVGKMGYDQRMAREESLIFFVRRIEEPETPFVTVSYSPTSKRVLQCYAYNNSKPDETVLTFVNKVWLPYANRKIKKLFDGGYAA